MTDNCSQTMISLNNVLMYNVNQNITQENEFSPVDKICYTRIMSAQDYNKKKKLI